jgi:uncharacterized protein with PQ loop repeat
MHDFINLQNIVGWLLIYGGILDAYKYIIQGLRIKQDKSAKSISRRFINYAIFCDIIKLLYSIIIKDFYIFTISIIALICMEFMWYEMYIYYPYKNRNLLNFKRPNIFIYIINSLLPNNQRKRL